MKLLTPRLLGSLAWGTLTAIRATMKIEERFADEKFRLKGEQSLIYATWHGRMLMPMFAFRRTGAYILVSEHRDGEIITSSLEAAGYNTVRGSTSRSGARALASIVKLGREGRQCGFTPDGPRGPRWHFQPGAIYAAAKTGLPILPVTGSVSKAYYFNSWDRFQLPLPFSRGVMLAGTPYYVTGGVDPENIETHRANLERILISLTREADEIVGAVEP